MKKFTTAVKAVLAEDEREVKIKARVAELVAEGKTQEEATATAEEEAGPPEYVAFELDGREMHAYPPTDGQLVFMMASMGRGQTKDSRFASIINIMMESLREEDAVYFESRLLTRDPRQRLGVEEIEDIFAFLAEEWFADPTQSPSDSA